MKQAAILTGVILIGIGLMGYFGQWADITAQQLAEDSSTGQADGTSTAGTADNQDNSDSEGSADGSSENNKSNKAESKPKAPSPTALFPAAFGLLILLGGLIAMREDLRKHAMHFAAAISLLGGIAGLVRGIPGLIKILNDDPDVNRRSVIFVWLMAIVCFAFVFMAVNSFIAAKKARLAEKG